MENTLKIGVFIEIMDYVMGVVLSQVLKYWKRKKQTLKKLQKTSCWHSNEINSSSIGENGSNQGQKSRYVLMRSSTSYPGRTPLKSTRKNVTSYISTFLIHIREKGSAFISEIMSRIIVIKQYNPVNQWKKKYSVENLHPIFQSPIMKNHSDRDDILLAKATMMNHWLDGQVLFWFAINEE